MKVSKFENKKIKLANEEDASIRLLPPPFNADEVGEEEDRARWGKDLESSNSLSMDSLLREESVG